MSRVSRAYTCTYLYSNSIVIYSCIASCLVNGDGSSTGYVKLTLFKAMVQTRLLPHHAPDGKISKSMTSSTQDTRGCALSAYTCSIPYVLCATRTSDIHVHVACALIDSTCILENFTTPSSVALPISSYWVETSIRSHINMVVSIKCEFYRFRKMQIAAQLLGSSIETGVCEDANETVRTLLTRSKHLNTAVYTEGRVHFDVTARASKIRRTSQVIQRGSSSTIPPTTSHDVTASTY